MQKSPGERFFSPPGSGHNSLQAGLHYSGEDPWKEVPTCEENAERNLHAARLGGGNVCAGFAGCVPSQMFLAESERCSVLWGESLQPCSPSCRDVWFFSSLFDKEMQISHRPDRLLAVFFPPSCFRSSRVATDPNQMEARQTAPTRPPDEPLRARRSDSRFSTPEQEPVLTFAPEISSRASAWLR